MDLATARRLIGPDGQAALAAAVEEDDLDAPGAASRLRMRFDPDLAAAALTQVGLRRRARTKFGAEADTMWFTTDGLQQASRPDVAKARATRLATSGARTVVDLGCGIGADTLALARAGFAVTAVERDPVTAALAEANAVAAGLMDRVHVVVGEAAEHTADGESVFCDPARRTDRGRVWRVEQFSPGWDVVLALLDGARPCCVKLGPALPTALIPDGVEAEWVSHRGDVVEAALWAGPGARPGARDATLLPTGEHLVRTGPAPALPTSPVGRYVYEPDGAAIRAGLVTVVGERAGAMLLDPHLAYLTGDTPVDSPWLTCFAVDEVLPYTTKIIKSWLSTHDIGRLEIKKRGVDVDPAVLRRRLKPHGSLEATMIISRSPTGTLAIMAHREVQPGGRSSSS